MSKANVVIVEFDLSQFLIYRAGFRSVFRGGEKK
jgi:hypothetical protein